jgi:hypothetical protein
MTSAEVSRSMGFPPSDKERVSQVGSASSWEPVTVESNERPGGPSETTEVWLDGSVATVVNYQDGKAALKMLEIRVPSWKIKARAWLAWLRGLAGL